MDVTADSEVADSEVADSEVADSEPAGGERTRTPRKQGYLFVVTYGRSGSTLVQGLLNTLPGLLIRGENNFFILPMFRSYDALAGFYGKHREDRLAHLGSRWAFYGLDETRLDVFVGRVRGLMLKQLIGSTKGKSKRKLAILGFKEIRWFQIEPKETERFFDFFEQLFPDARYVLNRRDHEQVASSGFWQKQETDDVLVALRRVEEIQEFLRRTRPERTHVTRYEQITSSDDEVMDKELRSLAGFVLGEYDDELIHGMKKRLKKGHGPRPFGRSRPDEAPTGETEKASPETPTPVPGPAPAGVTDATPT